MLIRRPDQRGFTLIELMVGITIIGLLLTQALPSFTTWLRNLQIRNSAEAVLNGLQLAKAQAVRSNTNTELLLINAGTPPDAVNVGTAAVANGTNWIVRNYRNPISGGSYVATDFVQGRSGQEGSTNATVVAGPGSGDTPGGPWNSGSYVFTPLGRLLNPPAGAVNITVDSADAYTDKRKMCIIVSTGGQILMCDPNGADATNPQFCPGACP